MVFFTCKKITQKVIFFSRGLRFDEKSIVVKIIYGNSTYHHTNTLRQSINIFNTSQYPIETYELLIRTASAVEAGRSRPFPLKDSCNLPAYWLIEGSRRQVSRRTSTPLRIWRVSLFLAKSRVWKRCFW